MASEEILQVNEYVFGLDIGTRSIVGLVGFQDGDQLKIIGQHTILHDTRAMFDGQIHDIEKVAHTVREVKEALEKQIGFTLKNVCIAAAGRVLKTYEVHVEDTMDNNTIIDKDHVHMLELMAIEKAHQQLNEALDQDDTVYHCVGYTVTHYYLNDYVLSHLEGHKGKKIGVDLLATFLPQEVVDSLHTVIKQCDLNISNLTLEPIAAIGVAIPEQYRLLNIALVDIGAGTSDIAITKEGSIIAYGMIPMAGDEITEQIVHDFLVDFKTAEKIKLKLHKKNPISFKDIMGLSHKVQPEEIFKKIQPTLDKLAQSISNKIKELNGNKSTNAVFCVGGGGQIKSFTDLLAGDLDLPKERVALRGAEVLNQVIFDNKSFKKPEMVTPVGICLSGLNKDKTDFISLTVNGEPIKIFNNNNLTLIDVVAYKGFNHKNLICRKGEDLCYTLNGVDKKHRGTIGEPAVIQVNGDIVGLNYPIGANDEIELTVAKHGQSPVVTIETLLMDKALFDVFINGRQLQLPYRIAVNGHKKDERYVIQNKDQVVIEADYTVTELLELSDIQQEDCLVYVNDQIVPYDYVVQQLDKVTIQMKKDNMEIEEAAVTKIIPTIPRRMKVMVNNQEIILQGKERYIFVDIFDYIDFDLRHPKGKIVCLVNGKTASYMENIDSGDQIEVYWDK
ncbi:rod shape-determining protein [Vallitalea pronyensis]|uniref:Rod shape-determining protein n=1 Tax=Vallitalea pronyensis TaxID=1348613 RepID=A0A8J8MKL2_9FIRM|nr:cell division FtsA domain-containing protein [Vallitalea pronyensis]QUI23450.1 rod shape-determining protein [Vallitalea pronyensis]